MPIHLTFYKIKNLLDNGCFSNVNFYVFLNYQFGKITVNLPTPLYKNASAKIFIENYKNGNIIKPWIKSGWSFRNQINEFIKYIKGFKKNDSLCDAKKGVTDIKIIEDLFKK